MDVRSEIESNVKGQIQKVLRAEMVTEESEITLSYTHPRFWSDQFSDGKIANRALDQFDMTFLRNWLAAKKKPLYIGSLAFLGLIVLFAVVLQLLSSSSMDQQSSRRNRLAFVLLPLAVMFIASLLIHVLTKYLFKLSLKDDVSIKRYINEKADYLYVQFKIKQVLDDLSLSGQVITWHAFHLKIIEMVSAEAGSSEEQSARGFTWRTYLDRKFIKFDITREKATTSDLKVDTTADLKIDTTADGLRVTGTRNAFGSATTPKTAGGSGSAPTRGYHGRAHSAALFTPGQLTTLRDGSAGASPATPQGGDSKYAAPFALDERTPLLRNGGGTSGEL